MNEVKTARHAVNPSSEWIARNRSIMLSQIKNTVDCEKQASAGDWLQAISVFFQPRGMVYAVARPVFVFALMLVLGTAGWLSTVSAAHNSLPGDMMYPVKLATEKTQVAVVEVLQGNAASAEMRLSFVSRRAEELDKINNSVQLDEKTKKTKATEVVAQMQAEVKNVNDKLEAAKIDAPIEAKAVAAVIDSKTVEIKNILQETSADVSTKETVAAVDLLSKSTELVKQMPIASAPTSTPVLAEAPTSTPVLDTPTSTPALTKTIHQVTSTPIKLNEKLPPIELAPEVVDTSTPVHLETWD